MEIGAEENPDAIAFYKEILKVLTENNSRFMIGGTYALKHYTRIEGSPKDMDVFCLPPDFPAILNLFADNGWKTEHTDARWLGKVFKDKRYTDIIFSSVNQVFYIDEDWYKFSTEGEMFGYKVRFIPAEELLWSKIFVQNRERYDGADINHLILRYGHKMDWERVWKRVETYWQIFYAHIILFRFVYPSEKNIIPEWLVKMLTERAAEDEKLPPAIERVCRGPLIDQTQYRTDIIDWGFKSFTITTI
jgi:predicted nucleotidyltransferase